MSQERAILSECRATLAHGSKSFALAVRLLPPRAADSAAAVYAYCRRVDDAIDHCPREQQDAALLTLRNELAAIYRGDDVQGADKRAFQAVVRLHAVPERYPRELLAGMAMDVHGTHYETLAELLLYCHRVAGVVGLMMCHVFGLTRDSALEQARDLGIAMQLTNICRDVAEDFAMGRVYLPRQLLVQAGFPIGAQKLGCVFADARARLAVRQVIRQLLAEAEWYYRSAEHGISALPFRAGLAVRVAARLYRAIGTELVRRGCDPEQGRVVTSRRIKLWAVSSALVVQLGSLPIYLAERLWLRRGSRLPGTELLEPPGHTR